jgi:hypothetical protein
MLRGTVRRGRRFTTASLTLSALSALSALTALTATLIGCTATGGLDPVASPTGTNSQGSTVSIPATSTPITITINGRTLSGALSDNVASRSLSEQLPLTLDFSDFGGQEKIARLPAPLSIDGMPAADDADPLTIGYYAPEQSLVLYYEHVGRFNGIVRLGTLDAFAPDDFPSPFIATMQRVHE